MRSRLFIVMSLALPLAGCDGNKKAAAPTREPPVVSVAKPILMDYQPHAEFTGRTAAVEEVEVRPRVAGFLESVNFQAGSDVTAGETLFEIDARPFQADVDRAIAEVARTESAFKQAEIELARMKDLYEKESATQIEFERHAAAREMANAELSAAKAALQRAKLDLEWTKVTAPISGRVSRNFVDAGNLVLGGQGSGTVLTRIVTIDPIHVYFDIDERTVLECQARIREGKMEAPREGIAPIRLGLANEEGFPHEGGIDFVDNKVDISTGTLRVRGKFENADRVLAPGFFARIRLFMGAPYKALSVSERALGFDQGQRYLLIVNARDEVEYRAVKVGGLDGEMRVIDDGIGPEDWVIVNGLQRVRPGIKVKTQRVDMKSMESKGESAPSGKNDSAAPAGATSQPTTKSN